MIKYIAFILIVALRIVYHPTPAESATAPFTKPSSSAIAPASKIKPVDGGIITNKVTPNRVVDENEIADAFKAEKTADRKSFSARALGTGTGISNTANYRFYEKAGNQRVLPSL